MQRCFLIARFDINELLVVRIEISEVDLWLILVFSNLLDQMFIQIFGNNQTCSE